MEINLHWSLKVLVLLWMACRVIAWMLHYEIITREDRKRKGK